MSTYDEIVAQNRREAAEAVARAMGMTIPPPVPLPVPEVPLQPPRKVPLQREVVPLQSGERKQSRWNRANADKYRTWRTEYMRAYRQRKATNGLG